MAKQFETEIKVGLFVALGMALIMLAILVLGSTESLFSRRNDFRTYFNTVEGLVPGAKVVLGGITAGVVESIEIDPEKRMVRVEYTVQKKYSDWVRTDSEAEIATQGVLGDKYISVTLGSAENPVLESGSEIPSRPGKDLTQFLSKGDKLMVNLNSISASLDRILRSLESGGRSDQLFQGLATTSKNLAQVTDKLNKSLDDGQLKGAVRNLNAILAKINNGTGTLGALVNDPGLYDDAKALLGGANRNRVIRNLVRQTVKKGDEAQAEATQEQQDK